MINSTKSSINNPQDPDDLVNFNNNQEQKLLEYNPYDPLSP